MCGYWNIKRLSAIVLVLLHSSWYYCVHIGTTVFMLVILYHVSNTVFMLVLLYHVGTTVLMLVIMYHVGTTVLMLVILHPFVIFGRSQSGISAARD